jgi:16S rRNA (uracil1498-N3)-methyltransferase
MSKEKHTFFCEDPASGILSAEESNHAVRVLRLSVGHTIGIIDGKGHYHQAVIRDAHKKKVLFEIRSTAFQAQPNVYVHVAIAPTKNMDRLMFCLEKCIEIGIQRITPLLCANSERKHINQEKLIKHALSAAKQSGQLHLPIIDSLAPFTSFIHSDLPDAQYVIAHCEDDQTKRALKDVFQVDKNIVILIGPEGDFTPEEINLAIEHNFQPVSLGDSRLRTETAGIVACHTVRLLST